jgi:phage shock protein C
MTEPVQPSYRRLTLSSHDRMIGGVCGGLAEYFRVDPTIVRIIAVVLAVLGGSGVLAYLLAWLIMPRG